MLNQNRIRDYGVVIGKLETGSLNAITNVAGVSVGQVTFSDENVQTGVTAIISHQDNIFENKLVDSTHVINGFGKSMGTIQISELGTLESPIILTNTLSIGVAADTLIDYMLEKNPEIGRITSVKNRSCMNNGICVLRRLHTMTSCRLMM